MATQQTRTQRQATAKKAAATRQRNAAKRSAATTKGAARQTRRSAGETARSAKATARSGRATTKRAASTAGRQVDAATTRLDAFGRQAERALLIQIGAAVTVRDAIVQTVQTYTDLDLMTREFDRFERRGERAVRGSRHVLRRRRRDFEHGVGTLGTEAAEAVKSIA